MTRACVDELVDTVQHLLQIGEHDEPAAIEAFRELLDAHGTALVGAALAAVEHAKTRPEILDRDHVPGSPAVWAARSAPGPWLS